jgi:two-component system, NtrC family, sensor histidine kinase HydH
MIAALALLRGTKSTLSLPLTLLGIDQFTWNVATVGWQLTHHHRWIWLMQTSAPLFIAFALHLVLVFVGKRRVMRWVLITWYVLTGLLSAAALILGSDAKYQPVGAIGTLVVGLPVAVIAVTLIVRHARGATTDLERYRTRVLLTAVVAATVLLTTDLFNDLGFGVPRLSHLGGFAFSALMTHLTLSLGLFESDKRGFGLVHGLLLGLFTAVAYLALFSTLAGNEGLLIVGVSAVTLAVVGMLRTSSAVATQRREGLERFATLGRFSAQMAHDLKNPLAAAKGATDYLREEIRQGRPPQQTEFVDLVAEQLDRLARVIDKYQRMSRLEPKPTRLELNALVKRVLALQSFAAPNVAVQQQLGDPPPVVTADADLLAAALENLVNNAFQAMNEGKPGHVTVSTRTEDGAAVLAVQDDGKGMDARQVERAFEPFRTTKANGSGLGLAFTREVARAHGGDARLSSREGQGTLVEVMLPMDEAR